MLPAVSAYGLGRKQWGRVSYRKRSPSSPYFGQERRMVCAQAVERRLALADRRCRLLDIRPRRRRTFRHGPRGRHRLIGVRLRSRSRSFRGVHCDHGRALAALQRGQVIPGGRRCCLGLGSPRENPFIFEGYMEV